MTQRDDSGGCVRKQLGRSNSCYVKDKQPAVKRVISRSQVKTKRRERTNDAVDDVIEVKCE